MPLHWATGHGHVGAVRALVEVAKVRKINTKDQEGWSPLHRCCQQPPPRDKPKEGEEPPPPIDMADEDGKRCQIAGMLLAAGADASLREAKSLNTPIHLCAMNGYARVLETILSNRQQQPLDVDPVNKISKTPLIYACMEDQLETVLVLLKYNADPLKKDRLHNEWNAVHFAIMQDNVAIVKAILDDAKTKAKYDNLIKVTDAVGRSFSVVAEDHFKSNVAQYLAPLI